MNGSKNKFMELAIALSEKSVAEGGGPFGAVVVRRGEVVATGTNSVTLLNDPTAHAEVSAIRAACDDSFIYDQIPLAPSRRTVPSEEMMRAEALQAFRLWERKEDKVEY